ncbi:Mog1p/PsbP-like protein [Microstroma glucosiphilum]|uniref:Mog1p/PsbP-like protein n=1 Tax=Pseudomicrostroma glucosiphilum TaxID=1684307 RepID=A0A316U1S4_9BASI|nr:Mog1p/PsbP-like protein [Pseudomicrostroma glucosiphilum]PWN19326.1 Mog1p/PsbP-like protein [Pseudomicrostroma glucosiphilum]
MASTSRELFGGAITSQLPQGLIDASDLRQIPDNQEVLLFPGSDVTCVVEVLETVTEGQAGSNTEEAIRFHFSSLAHDNEAETSEVLRIESLGGQSLSEEVTEGTPSPTYLTGLQRVRKFNKHDSPLDLVLIHLALWRLAPKRPVDLVMSWNEPLALGKEATEQGHGDASAMGDASIRDKFKQAATSLRIEDWGLFA